MSLRNMNIAPRAFTGFALIGGLIGAALVGTMLGIFLSYCICNPLIAQNLREFPVPPNIDAGEGVKMMFSEMAAAKLYPPQYRQSPDAAP
mgnify:CR=1 FL=1